MNDLSVEWVMVQRWIEPLGARALLSGGPCAPTGFVKLDALQPEEVDRGGGGVQFVTTFNDPALAFTSYYEAIDAMVQAAGRDWASVLSAADSSVEVEVRFSGSTTSTGSSVTSRFVGTQGAFSIYEQGMAGELRTGVDPNGIEPDVRISLGPNYLRNTLWFDPDPSSRNAPIPPDRIDAYSVFLHELGHALAYNGWRHRTTGSLPGNYMSPFDQLVVFQGDQPFFAGAAVLETYGGHAALTYGSLPHWGNRAPRPGEDLIPELMNGVVKAHQTRYDIGALDVALLRDVTLPLESTSPEIIDATLLFEQSQRLKISFSESVRRTIPSSQIVVRHPTLGDFSSSDVCYDRATDTAFILLDSNGVIPDGDYQIIPNGLTDVAGNPALPSDEGAFFVLAADATRDRKVNLNDFTILAANFGQINRVFSQGDFNYDARVDLNDFTILATQFGKALPARSEVSRTTASASTTAKPSPRPSLFSEKRIVETVLDI